LNEVNLEENEGIQRLNNVLESSRILILIEKDGNEVVIIAHLI